MQKAIFEIFRTGKHNGRNANGKEWTEADLKATATLYNEAVQSAPLVIGHPEDNQPQYGTVKRVIYCKNALFAEAEISPELVQKVKQDEISGISSSFLQFDHSKNPTQGLGYYLNHVGFLPQTMQPAVKNMLPPEISVETLAFSEAESEAVLFCEADYAELAPSERLHEKILYFQRVLAVDYETALNFILTP